MERSGNMQQKEISKAVIKRLPTYLSYLRNLPEDAPPNISATTLANALGMDYAEVEAIFEWYVNEIEVLKSEVL